MTAQQLKNSILQMAVQGKLVPQDPNDEPASVLLERIRAEKEQLIKQKKIKREKKPSYIFRGADNTPYEKIGSNEPVSIADEVPFEIPDSWEWIRLKDLVEKEIKRGKSPKYADRGTVFVFAQKCNVKQGGIDMSLAKYLDMKTFDKYPTEEYMRDGDIIINSTGNGTLGRIGMFHDSDRIDDNIIVPDSHVTLIRIMGSMQRDYLYHVLKYYQPYLEDQGEGSTNQTELRPSTVAELFIPIPPVAEQIRITAKLVELLPLVDVYGAKATALDAYNKDFPKQLKKSILQMAVQGKLVPQDPADEPASVLLERIRAEKQRLIAEGKIKRDKHESVIFRRDNSHYEKCGSVETCIDDIIPFEVPGNWIWVRLGTLIEEKPSNGYSPKGVPYSTNVKNLTLSATTSGYFKSDAYKYVDIEIPSDSKYWLKHNDILIQRSNSRELVGTACIYTGKDNEFIYPDLMMRIRAMNRIDIRYLDLVLKAPFSRRYFTSSASGTSDSMPKINQTIVTNTFVPLPPIEEQRRIMAFVDKLFSCLTF